MNKLFKFIINNIVAFANLSAFNDTCDHDNASALVLINHTPKVNQCLFFRSCMTKFNVNISQGMQLGYKLDNLSYNYGALQHETEPTP
jgi:hypothetical protein